MWLKKRKKEEVTVAQYSNLNLCAVFKAYRLFKDNILIIIIII